MNRAARNQRTTAISTPRSSCAQARSPAGCIGRTPTDCRVPDADDEKEAAP